MGRLWPHPAALAAAQADALLASLPGAEAHVCPCAAAPGSADAALAAALAHGPVAGVANCIGSVLLKPAHSTTDAELASVMLTNVVSRPSERRARFLSRSHRLGRRLLTRLHAPSLPLPPVARASVCVWPPTQGTSFSILRASVKAMTRPGAPGGSIVLCSSAVARHGLANHEAIAAAKGAVLGLTLSAAATYAPQNVRVNAVSPGLTRTPMTSRITGNEAALKMSTAMHALGRIGEAGDVARAIAFLLDPQNAFITGQNLGVDGGLGSLRPR